MKLLEHLRLARFAALAMVFSAVAACDDSTGLGDPADVDPVAAASAVSSVNQQFFAGNEGLTTMGSLQGQIFGALGPSVAALVVEDIGLVGQVAQLSALRSETLARRASLMGGGELQRIPVGLLGKTLVYDEGTDSYIIDQARTDAPPNGVRFILYALNPVDGKPLSPPSANEVGYVDIIDTSSFPTVSIAVTVNVNGVDYVDVSTTGTFDQTSQAFTLSSSGTLSDGAESLSFSLALNATATTFGADFSLSHAGVSVAGSVDFDETAGTGTFHIEIREGNNLIVFDASEDAQGVASGTVTFNGAVVAIISGQGDNITITNGEGDPLTEAEIAALHDLFDAIEAIFDALDGLFEFTFSLLLLGLA